MSHLLTNRNLSTIARLDLSGMTHAQRLEAIARALGYGNYAAFLANEVSPKATAHPEPQAVAKPTRCVIAFGESLTSALEYDESLFDGAGDMRFGQFEEYVFDTPAEMKAYFKGIEDRSDWNESTIAACEANGTRADYFAALDKRPDLSFETWYQARHAADQVFEDTECDPTVIGFQVDDPETGENWKDSPSFLILTEGTAREHINEAFAAGETRFRVLPIREGTIEEPSFE